MVSKQGLPVLKMWSLCWGFWKGLKELANIWNLMRALCQCSLCFLESPSLAYIILASWASTVMNHCEKPDRAADRTSTETHVEEIQGINTLHWFPWPALLCGYVAHFWGTKKNLGHISTWYWAYAGMVGNVFISMLLNKDAHLSILFWLSLPFQDVCVTSLWITEIKELPMQKRNSTNMKPLECFLHQPFPFSLVQCVWIVSMMWYVVTKACRRLLIFLLQYRVNVRFGRAVEFCSNALSL